MEKMINKVRSPIKIEKYPENCWHIPEELQKIIRKLNP